MPASYQARDLSASDENLLSKPYLARQLIAYIGNKRKLLPMLLRIFRGLEARRPVRSLADPFCGSGAVARLGRAMGYQVIAGDMEEYARVLASAFLTIQPREAEDAYAPFGGLRALLGRLNSLTGVPRQPYISRHYAPRTTAGADYRTERLFYTRENALFIDLVREEIERLFPETSVNGNPQNRKAKDLLVALLIYEAATHVNTSGVFKACHKGFGGHNGDALSRITEPMRLEYPHLWEGNTGCRAEKQDAASLLRGPAVDLCYLDPPYNGHQYGSNYHLLNTIALWDKPPVNDSVTDEGRLQEKAGIRRDWIATRSAFCSRQGASAALREVLEAADARWIVLSYNSEGIIPFGELYELLSEYGAVEIETLDYTTYRGGRQSISRKTHNQEFQLVITSGEQPGKDQRHSFERFLWEQRLLALLREPYEPTRLTEAFHPVTKAGALLLFPERGSDFPGGWSTDRCYRFTGRVSRQDLAPFDLEELRECCQRLRGAVCADRREEFDVLYRFLSADTEGGKRRNGQQQDERRILGVLRKFAHRKYAREFAEDCARLHRLTASSPGRFSLLEEKLPELEELARRRFSG